MTIQEVTAATLDAITLEEARDHLRQYDTDDDEYIELLIPAVTRVAETVTRRALLTSTWKLFLDRLPANTIFLPKGQAQSVTHVKYYDSSDTLQTLASDQYVTDLVSEPARICREFTATWPVTYQRPNAVEVQFVAGWTARLEIPGSLRQAMFFHLAHFFENRTPVIIGPNALKIPWTLQVLYETHRIMKFY